MGIEEARKPGQILGKWMLGVLTEEGEVWLSGEAHGVVISDHNSAENPLLDGLGYRSFGRFWQHSCVLFFVPPTLYFRADTR